MLAEIIPGSYDFEGKRVLEPSKKRYPFFKNRAMGIYFDRPLEQRCGSVEEVRTFLKRCRYVSDEEQFGVRDHWAPPHEFEKSRKGDCDDFALWTWRQLVEMGHSARFVCGRAGRYGGGHAWVTVRLEDREYLVEPLAARVGIPRLETLRYWPALSVEMRDRKPLYFEHRRQGQPAPFPMDVRLLPEWILFRMRVLWLWIRWPFAWLWYGVRRLTGRV